MSARAACLNCGPDAEANRLPCLTAVFGECFLRAPRCGPRGGIGVETDFYGRVWRWWGHRWCLDRVATQAAAVARAAKEGE
jgi:hypothetical protein